MKAKLVKLKLPPSDKISYTLSSNKNGVYLSFQPQLGQPPLDMEGVMTITPAEEVPADTVITPEIDEDFSEEPTVTEPLVVENNLADESTLFLPDVDHVYSQLRVWNNTMDKVLLRDKQGKYVVYDFPSLTNPVSIEPYAYWRWYGTKLYGTTEQGIIEPGGKLICALPDGDTVDMSRSYEDINGGRLAILNDAHDKIYICNVSTRLVYGISLPQNERQIDTVAMMPKGDTYMVNFNPDGTGPGQGMWLYDLNGKPLMNLDNDHNHFDTGVDPDGREFVIKEEYGNDQKLEKCYTDGTRVLEYGLGDWNFWHVSSRAFYTKRSALTNGPFHGDDKTVEIIEDGKVITTFSHAQSGDVDYDRQPQATISNDGKWVCFDVADGVKFGKID